LGFAGTKEEKDRGDRRECSRTSLSPIPLLLSARPIMGSSKTQRTPLTFVLIPRDSSSRLGCHQPSELSGILDDVLNTAKDSESEFMDLSNSPHVIAADRPDESLPASGEQVDSTSLLEVLSSEEDEDDSLIMHRSPTSYCHVDYRVKQSPLRARQGQCMELRVDDVLLTPRRIEEMIRSPFLGL